MAVDKRILDIIGNISSEERKALWSVFQLSRHKPEMKLIMAIFRDAYVFREMSNALIVKYSSELNSLRNEVEQIKTKLKMERDF